MKKLFPGNIFLLAIFRKKKQKQKLKYYDSLLSSTRIARVYQSAHAYCTARAYLTYMCSTLTFRLLRNKPILCCTCVTCVIATFHCVKVHHKFEFNLFGVGEIVSRQHLPSRHLKKKTKTKTIVSIVILCCLLQRIARVYQFARPYHTARAYLTTCAARLFFVSCATNLFFVSNFP